MNSIANNAAKMLQKMPFVDRLFAEKNLVPNLAVGDTLELRQPQRPVVANEMLNELATDLAQRRTTLAFLSRLAVKRIKAFKIEATTFKCDLAIRLDSTVAELEGSKAILRLFQSDNLMQQALTEANKAMVQVEEQMVSLDRNVQRLEKDGISPSADVMEKLRMELNSSIKELNESTNLFDQVSQLVNWLDAPSERDELQTKVFELVPQMEKTLDFPINATYSAETKDLCNQALALHLEKIRNAKDKENVHSSLNEWSKWSEKVKDTVHAEDERLEMHTIMHERNLMLRIVAKKLNLKKLEQLEKMLEQQVLGSKPQKSTPKTLQALSLLATPDNNKPGVPSVFKNSTPTTPDSAIDPSIITETADNNAPFWLAIIAVMLLIVAVVNIGIGLTSEQRSFALLVLITIFWIIVIHLNA